MSLTTCIRKAGTALRAEDKNAILARTRELMKAGQSAQQAAEQAVDAQIATVRALLSKYADPNYQPAPAAPQAAPKTSQEAGATQDSKTPKPSTKKDNPTVEKGSGSVESAIANMIDDGDVQAAVDFAAAKKVDIREVLKDQKARRAKINGVVPTEAADVPLAPDLKGFRMVDRDGGGFDLVDGNMVVRVEPTDAGKFQAAFRGAKSTPHLQGVQGAVDWAAEYRKDASAEQPTPAQEPEPTPEPAASVEPPKEGIQDLGEKIGGARKDMEAPSERKAAAKPSDDRPAWARRFAVSQIVKSTKEGEEGRWAIHDTKNTDWKGEARQIGPTFATKEEADKFVPLAAVALKHRVRMVGDKYEIWRNVTDRKAVKVVDRQFDTNEEATAYMVAHAAEILEANTTFGEESLPLPKELERIGIKRRDGDVKGQDFIDTFGFRGVEFGNWNSQEERQRVMNEAFDGLMDLAEVLRVPPRALSLNGDLAVAFGARGHGLSSARAHYEPAKAVINLTKMKGAGALAHEWFHAVDHYFARQDGKAPAEWVTEKDGTRSLKIKDDGYLSEGVSYKSGVRKEIADAYVALGKVMTTKAEQYVEDTAQADRFVGKMREELAAHLQRIRDSIATKSPYGRKRDPASAEQLASFDAIAANLLAGNDLTTEFRKIDGAKSQFGGRTTNDSLEAINTILKDVRGRQGFISQTKNGTLDQLSTRMRLYAARLQMLQSAQAGEAKTKRVPTSFAMAAKELDQGRSGDYWTSPREMFARAFQGYVEDKIAQGEGYSPFLNYAPENYAILTPWGAARPYPHGTERKAINAAFDTLVSALETKTDDAGNVVMFSRAPSYGDKVDAVLAGGVPEDAAVSVTEPLQVLEALGMPALPVQTTAGRLNKMHFDHGLTAADLKALPSLLEQPVMVFESATQPGSKVLVLDLWRRGMPVLAAVHPNVKLKRLDVNLLASAYPKDRPEQLGNWFKNGLLRYADKEKTRAWATNGGVQFPWLVQLQRGSAKSVLGPSDVGKPAARRTDTPATSSSAQQLADHLSDVWANAPRVVVVDSMADSRVPQVARDELARQDEGTPTDGKTTAFYYNDTVYLIGEQSEREALTSLFHEVLGHHGLRHAFPGGELRTILDRIAQLNPGLVRERAIAYGLGRWVDDGDGKRFQYGRFDKEGRFLGGEQVARQTAAEELLARMAQTRPQLGWVRRALAAIRTWLRKHVPGFGAMKFSDAELIRSFILPARAWVERGASEKAPQTSDAPAFARTDTDASQIKSATGNRGTFDPNNPDVRFSRVSDAIDTLKSATTEKGLRDILSDHLTSDKTFNWWHNTIGTQYQKAKADPTHFGPVYEAAQDYLHDTSAFANDAAALAPDVVPQLKGWRDAFKPLRLSDADEQALASAIFTGTLQDQKVYTPDELRAQFNATDRQIALYQQMRAAIDRSLDQLVASDVARYLGQDIPKAIKDMISDGDTGRFKGLVTDLAQKKKAEADAALTEVRKANRKRLSDMHRAHKKRREAAKGPMARSNLEDVLATERAEVVAETKAREDAAKATYDKWNEFERTIKAKYERVDQLKQEGYAPLMRFGRYTVDVVSEGERQFFGLYESEADAKKAAREFRESGEFKGSTITTGLLSQEAYKQFSSMAPETIELFAEVAGVEQTPLFQEYLRRAKSNRAAIKRLIQRKGIAGFSEDAQRVLAAFLTSNARAASTNLHMGDMGRLIEAIPKEKGDVKDEAIRLKEYVQNPTEEAQRLRGLLFVQYLGGSIASALVNMTQPLTMTLPYLSQFGGLGKAGARLADAMKSAMHKQTGALGAALAKAEKEGVVSPQELHQLQAESSRTMGNHPGVRRLLFAWGSMFSLAEQFNRRVSFIAAWNTAVANGNPNPYQFAVDAVEQTQGVYNRGNRPNWARGPVGATVFTFKQFSISYLEFLKRLPPKERAIALAVLVLAAGAQGLPFADDLDDLIDTIGQHLGYDTNAKLWKTKVLTEALGEMGADFALHGFSALPGFPLDVSGRLAISNLIPGTGILRKNTSDKSSDVFEAIGPAGGVVRDAIRGDVVPLAFRNLAKSIQMYQTGEYRDSRDRKVMDVTGLDALVKGIGFQPAEVARESRGIQMRNQQVQLARNVEAEIASLWAQGIADKEPDKVREARQRLADWNRDNPQSRIGITTGQLERRVRDMRKTRQQRFEKAMPKEMRGTV